MRLLPVYLTIMVVSSECCGQLVDSSTLLAAVARQWGSVQAYECTMRSFNRLGERTDEKTIRFTFKRPDMARLDVLEGSSKGSAIARNAAGVITGRKGGLLKLLAIELKPDDPRVFNLRGRPFYDANWGAVLHESQNRIDSGWQVRLGGAELVGDTLCTVIEMEGHDEVYDITRERLWIDPVQALILRRRQFDGDVLVNDVEWSEIRLEASPADAVFSL